MSNSLSEDPVWRPGVAQLETTTPVRGGPAGESNVPLRQLAERTLFLRGRLDEAFAQIALRAPLESPDFAGAPRAVTPAFGDRSRRLPTTEWVREAVSGVALVALVPGQNAVPADAAARRVLVFTGALASPATANLPAAAGHWILVNRTEGGQTVTVRAAGGAAPGVTLGSGGGTQWAWADGQDVLSAPTEARDLALLGNPMAPTPPPGRADGRVATAAFARRWARGASLPDPGGGVSIDLTEEQAATPVVLLSGAPLAPFEATFPAEPARWTIRNTTGRSARLRVAGQPTETALDLAPGRQADVFSDGARLRHSTTETRDMLLRGAPAATTPAPSAAGEEVVTAAWIRAFLAGQALYSTGDFKATFKTTPDPGWLFLDGRTIGDAGSGATARAARDANDLFVLLWAAVPALPVNPGGRGANAAADFAAGKTLALPDFRGRALVCAGAGPGLTARAAGDVFGLERVTLSAAEMPEHDHAGQTSPGGTHGHNATVLPGGEHSHSISISPGGVHSHPAAIDPAGDHQHAQGSESLYNNAGGGIFIGFRDYPIGPNPSFAAQLTFGAGAHGHGITIQPSGEHAHGAGAQPAPNHVHGAEIAQAPDHRHTIPAAGGGQPHPNIPPSMAANLMVKL